MKLNKQYLTLFLTISFIGLMVFFYIGFFSIESPSVSLNETRISSSPEVLYSGRKEFLVRCSKCHGIDADGSRMAPSLIDDDWLYGQGEFDSIYAIAKFGTPSGKMKGWGQKIRDEDIQAIALYLVELNERQE